MATIDSGWLNLVVASSNLYGLFGAYYYLNASYCKSALIICFCVFSSIAYHLVESYKHGMPGIKRIGYESKEAQMMLLNCDRIGAVLNSLLVLLYLRTQHLSLLPLLLTALVCEIIPELVSALFGDSDRHISVIPGWIRKRLNMQDARISSSLELAIYVVGHVTWHLICFHVSNVVAYDTVN